MLLLLLLLLLLPPLLLLEVKPASSSEKCLVDALALPGGPRGPAGVVGVGGAARVLPGPGLAPGLRRDAVAGDARVLMAPALTTPEACSCEAYFLRALVK